MCTSIEKLEKEEFKKASKHAYSSRLAMVLGNGMDWEYRGQWIKKWGFCTCGHEILNQFVIHNKKTGRSVVVGSVCVEKFPGINPQVVEGIAAELESMRAAIAEAKKKARELEQDLVVAELNSELDALFDKFDPYRERYEHGERLPYPVWYFLYSYRRFQWGHKEYKSKSALIKKLRSQIETVKNFIEKEKI